MPAKQTGLPRRKPENWLVANLRPGLVFERFLVHQAEQREGRNGRPYVFLRLGDKSGIIPCFHWCPDGEERIKAILESATPGKVMIVNGQVAIWEGRLQINIDPGKEQTLFDCPNDELAAEDYIRRPKRDPDWLFSEVEKIIEVLSNVHLRVLAQSLLVRNKELIKQAPAAVQHHHNYQGGLIEHIWEMLQLAETVTAIYPELNHDLLLAGVVLHDIGKIRTYKAEGFLIQMTDRERTHGHIALGAQIVASAVEGFSGFPEELADQVLHLVLSHHGEPELGHGSAVRPQSPEAIALYQIDLLNSRVRGVCAHNCGGA